MRRFTSEQIRDFVSEPRFGVEAAHMGDSAWPKISVVTPSRNQAAFLERTILSVLNQRYPNLEFIVVDGGSTDGSTGILRKYERQLARWVSEPDEGQSDALNKGFAMATGDLVAWQNSDDIYLPGALETVAKAFRERPGHDVYFGNMVTLDPEDRVLREHRYTPFSVKCLLYDGWNITNQSAFFRREIVRRYPFRKQLEYAMDGDFFVRVGRGGKSFRFIHAFLGALRIHRSAKGETISRSVGVEEWAGIREAEGIPVRPEIGWGRQFVLRKAACKLRKLGYYAIQGDWDYILRKIAGG